MNKASFNIGLMLLLLLSSCSSPSAHEVASQFINQLYQLDYSQMEKLATGDALLQAAILQGRLENADEETKKLYLDKRVVITSKQQTLSRAHINFDTIDRHGTTTSNSLEVEKIKGQWMVTIIEKSIVPTIKLFFN